MTRHDCLSANETLKVVLNRIKADITQSGALIKPTAIANQIRSAAVRLV